MHDKRAVESMIHTLHAEIDDALGQAKNSEEKAKRAMIDAARLSDELRAEQVCLMCSASGGTGVLLGKMSYLGHSSFVCKIS